MSIGRVPGIIANVSGIPNNTVWYDASVSNTTNFNTAPASGDDVGQWKDKSGGGHNASQSGNATKKPNWVSGVQNGYGVIRFNGTSESLNINPISYMQSQPAYTLFVVAKASDLTGMRSLVTTDTSGYKIGFNGTYYRVGAAGGLGVSTVTGDTTKFHVFTAVFDGSQTGNANRLKFRYDGASETLDFGVTNVNTATSASASQFNIGSDETDSTNYWQGDVGSVVIYTRALNTNELIGVESYLKSYWGL